MIDFGLFRFATPPRTGTTWLMRAAFLAGLGESQKAHVHEPHAPGPACRVLRVSLVRHPCDWLASYWRAIWPGQIAVEVVDRLAKLPGGSFDAFVRSYLRKTPGALAGIVAAYGADVVLRTEDLPWAFVELLESVGVPRRLRERCLTLSRLNASLDLPIWAPSLRRRVLDAERDLLDRFSY